MPQVQTMSGRRVTPPVVVVTGDRLSLKLLPETGERLPFAVTVSGPGTASVTVNNRIAANFATFVVGGVMAGDTRLTIQPASGGAALTLAVRVLAAIALPDPGTEAGMLTRLLLAENVAPGRGYTADSARESMTLMRVVLGNRLATPSGRWGSAGAATMRDVVRAPGQFHGFEAYPRLSSDMTALIADIVRRANTGGDPLQPDMRAHVEMAIAIASGDTPPDPTRTGLYWWRTAKRGASGTGTVEYKTLLGNTFYREGK